MLVSTLAPAVYESEAVVMVGQNPFQPVPTDTLVAFATLPSVTGSVVERVPGVRGVRMTASTVRNTAFLRLRVRGSSTDVARVANEWAAAVAAQSRATFALSPEYSLRVIAQAIAATRPPRPTARIVLAGFVGLAAGALAAFVVEALRPDRLWR